MKKHISVMMLITRGIIYKILPIILAMAVLQTGIFCAALYINELDLPSSTSPYQNAISLDKVLTDSHIELVLLAAFLGITALMIFNGCEFTSKQGYTLCRLQITERSVWIWQSVCNAVVYLILYTAELAVLMILCVIYNSIAHITGPQTVLLAFYRSDLAHSILPLAEISRLVRNIILILALGMTTAYFPYKHRRGKISKCGLVLTAAAVVNFTAGTGSYASDFILIIFSLIAGGTALYGVVFDGEEEVYEAPN